MGDAGLHFCLKSAGSTMPSRFQGRLSPLAREALAEVMATFILVVSTHSSSKTHGQIMGARKSLNGRKNMARRKVKNGEKSPWGQCLTRPVPNGRRRSAFWLVPENFCVFLPNQKAERRRPFGTGLIRHCPQGLFSPFFTFLPFSSPEPLGSIRNRPVANPSFPYHVTKKRRALGTRMLFCVPYFSARLDFPSPPLSAPWSPRMVLTIMNVSISFGLIYCSSKWEAPTFYYFPPSLLASAQ